MATAKAAPGKSLLDPSNHALVLIDFQSQMAFATKSIDAVSLRNNASLISKAAKESGVPAIYYCRREKLRAQCLRRSLQSLKAKSSSTGRP